MKYISDIIHSHYLESDLPELIITESGVIEEIVAIILESIEDDLKKSFKAREAISKLEENYELIEVLTGISERLLCNIDQNYGDLKLGESEPKMHDMWKLNK